MGEQSIPKRHHYIPQMMQRRFARADGVLYTYDKRAPQAGIRPSGPSNIFVEGHLYSQTTAAGVRDPALEIAFSELEGATNGIMEKIVTAARRRQKPNLSTNEKATWDAFFYYQWKRVPDAFASLKFDFEDELSRSIQQFESTIRPLTDDEKRSFDSPKERTRLKQNAWVSATSLAGTDVLEALEGKGLGITRVESPKSSFILGSFPIVKFTFPGRTDLRDPSVEMWLPIASDVAVTPYGVKGEEIVGPADAQRQVRYINTAVFKQSTVVASRSEKLIASLLRQR